MLNFPADLDTFLNPNHFASEFEVVSTTNVIRGIFQSPFLGVDMIGQMLDTEKVTLTVKTEDVVANQMKRSSQVRNLTDNTVWKVMERKDDSTGMTVLVIAEVV